MSKNRLTLIGAIVGISAALSGCCKNCSEPAKTAVHDETQCKEVKPGVITSVNTMCVLMPEDPVDPNLVAEWKGKKVGFCCQHCVEEWAKMTDAQREKSLAAAMKKK